MVVVPAVLARPNRGKESASVEIWHLLGPSSSFPHKTLARPLSPFFASKTNTATEHRLHRSTQVPHLRLKMALHDEERAGSSGTQPLHSCLPTVTASKVANIDPASMLIKSSRWLQLVSGQREGHYAARRTDPHERACSGPSELL